jgi:CcmD family protein
MVNMVSRVVLTLVLLLASSGPRWGNVVLAMQPPTGAAQEGFVPLDKLPPQEQLPAAPLLITAYAFVWVLLMVYLWSIARRLMKVEGEIQTLQRRSPGSSAR